MKRADLAAIRLAEPHDGPAWLALDGRLTAEAFAVKAALGQCYVLERGGELIGLLRYNYFWDEVPFCTLLFVAPGQRGRGCGRLLMTRWEDDMRAQGHTMAMTSTQSDEQAQHFYRRLGYRDAGSFAVDVPGHEQPPELIMIKAL